ncbi:tetratricopeptide repeat protein [Luteimonas sp. YGD11-2]|uniref:tetratricopeptide repeat protein n=1 Tax=Luteimonas sp. YGD11-2 TaxID=2508168 RepID=UPI00100AFB3E|nr:tetratricopeptide repeat protein [Luteimonas sp. YGD11-2]
MSRWRVAEVLARIERFDVALPMAREVLETQQRLLGARHPSSLLTALKYAGLLDLSGSRREALALVDEALPAALEVIGDGRGEVRAAMRLKEGGPAG